MFIMLIRKVYNLTTLAITLAMQYYDQQYEVI